MPKRVLLSGNEAVATALRQINPDVFPGISNYTFNRNTSVFF